MNRNDTRGAGVWWRLSSLPGVRERKDGERVGGGWCRWYAGWRARRVRGEEVLQGVGGFLLLPRGKGGSAERRIQGGYRCRWRAPGWVGRGEAVVLANLSTFWLVDLLGSWRGAAVYRWRWCARWVVAGQEVGGLAALWQWASWRVKAASGGGYRVGGAGCRQEGQLGGAVLGLVYPGVRLRKGV